MLNLSLPAFFGRTILVSTATVATLVGTTIQANAADAVPTPSALEADPSGWTDILPNPPHGGWYRVAVPPTAPLGRDHWHVDAATQTLVCDGDGGHDMLLNEKEYRDAIFHFECRYTKVEGKTGYNSGAYIRNSKNGDVWHQAQFGDGKDGFLFGATLADDGKKKGFNLRKEVTNGRVKPAGEWNTMELTARGKDLTLWINGAVTCTFTNCGAPSGFLGVEAEGYRIEFRNMKVKELK